MSQACFGEIAKTPSKMPGAYDADSLSELADDLRALADPTRLHIIYLLMTRGEMCVCEFMGLLDATQSNVSFHLKTLKYAGFITARKEGKWMFYSLNRKALEQFRSQFGEAFDLNQWPEISGRSSCDIPACKQTNVRTEDRNQAGKACENPSMEES